jgi:hypothetical protein
MARLSFVQQQPRAENSSSERAASSVYSINQWQTTKATYIELGPGASTIHIINESRHGITASILIISPVDPSPNPKHLWAIRFTNKRHALLLKIRSFVPVERWNGKVGSADVSFAPTR